MAVANDMISSDTPVRVAWSNQNDRDFTELHGNLAIAAGLDPQQLRINILQDNVVAWVANSSGTDGEPNGAAAKAVASVVNIIFQSRSKIFRDAPIRGSFSGSKAYRPTNHERIQALGYINNLIAARYANKAEIVAPHLATLQAYRQAEH